MDSDADAGRDATGFLTTDDEYSWSFELVVADRYDEEEAGSIMSTSITGEQRTTWGGKTW